MKQNMSGNIRQLNKTFLFHDTPKKFEIIFGNSCTDVVSLCVTAFGSKHFFNLEV